MVMLLSYLFYFVAASASPLQRRWLATKDRGEGQVAFAFRIALIIALLGLVLPLFEPFHLSGDKLDLLILTTLSGAFGAGYFITMYVAQKHVEAGVTTLVSNIYTPIAILVGTLALHEGLKPLQLLGAALLLISIFIVSNNHRISRFRFDKYFMMMIASGVALGLLLSTERALMKVTGFTAGTLLSWWSQAIGLGAAVLITRAKTTFNTKDTLVTGVLRFLQALSWVVLLFVVGNLSVVSAVTTFKVVVVFVASAIFLHERGHLMRKIIGSLVAVAGLLLMK